MSRLLVGVVLMALLTLPEAAAAASNASATPRTRVDLSARRCVCTGWRPFHVRVVRRHARRVAVRLPLRIGYDPLPYRFGYLYPPYRYIHRYAVVRVGPALYR